MTDDSLYRIEWAQNPLASCVVLTDKGRIRLQLGIAIDYLYEARASISLALRDKKFHWIEHFEYRGPEDVEMILQREAGRCEKDLLDIHCGDCTCVPAPCSKCHAEGMLGVDTIKGLGKHPGHKVQSIFWKGATLGQVIQKLDTEPITPTWGIPKDWAPHMERWEQERHDAVQWLRAYQQEHFSHD